MVLDSQIDAIFREVENLEAILAAQAAENRSAEQRATQVRTVWNKVSSGPKDSGPNSVIEWQTTFLQLGQLLREDGLHFWLIDIREKCEPTQTLIKLAIRLLELAVLDDQSDAIATILRQILKKRFDVSVGIGYIENEFRSKRGDFPYTPLMSVTDLAASLCGRIKGGSRAALTRQIKAKVWRVMGSGHKRRFRHRDREVHQKVLRHVTDFFKESGKNPFASNWPPLSQE